MADAGSPATNKASATSGTSATTPDRLTRKNIEEFHNNVWPALLEEGWKKVSKNNQIRLSFVKSALSHGYYGYWLSTTAS